MTAIGRRSFVALWLSALVTGCTSYVPGTATPPERLTVEAMRARINDVRRAHGATPVTYEPALAKAAQNQADLMAQRDTLSHDLGSTLRERVTAAGFEGAVGENVAGGHPTLEAAIAGWLESPAHRNTLLNGKFTRFGLAVARVGPNRKSRYGVYWALVMGGDFAAWL